MVKNVTSLHSARGDISRTVLGLWSLPMRAFIVGSIIAAYVAAWAWIAPPPVVPLGDLISITMPLALLVSSFVMLGTCRVMGDPAGKIDVFGPLLVRRISASAIARVDSSDGLRITLRSGRSIGSVAHGQSLLGSWAKYPRSARTASRIVEFMSRHPDDAAGNGPDVETHVRALGLAMALSLGALLLGVTILINRL